MDGRRSAKNGGNSGAVLLAEGLLNRSRLFAKLHLDGWQYTSGCVQLESKSSKPRRLVGVVATDRLLRRFAVGAGVTRILVRGAQRAHPLFCGSHAMRTRHKIRGAIPQLGRDYHA